MHLREWFAGIGRVGKGLGPQHFVSSVAFFPVKHYVILEFIRFRSFAELAFPRHMLGPDNNTQTLPPVFTTSKTSRAPNNDRPTCRASRTLTEPRHTQSSNMDGNSIHGRLERKAVELNRTI
jgi:hypothetical protein